MHLHAGWGYQEVAYIDSGMNNAQWLHSMIGLATQNACVKLLHELRPLPLRSYVAGLNVVVCLLRERAGSHVLQVCFLDASAVGHDPMQRLSGQ